jgi:preprotein translocase subunit SecD
VNTARAETSLAGGSFSSSTSSRSRSVSTLMTALNSGDFPLAMVWHTMGSGDVTTR